MRLALGLAARGLGNCAPNPAVGCVLVRNGEIVGRGWTQPGGRPHAETEALRRAGPAATGATAYVTLEPCAHHGRTGPCAQALVEAGVARVVVALRDPDPRVDGGGMALLRAAGIEVALGVCETEAADLNAGFLMRVRTGRPLVTVKLATTLDGRIATRAGASKWITGDDARAAAHLLRAASDAILVGAGTARADDPALTCRLPGLADRSPLRVFVDGALPLPVSHQLISGAAARPTVCLAPRTRAAAREALYARAGVETLAVAPGPDGRVDLAAALGRLAERGINRLLVEGGAAIAGALLAAGLVDRLVWFRAPSVIGGDGLAAAAGFGVDALENAPGFKLLSARPVGRDMMEVYKRAE